MSVLDGAKRLKARMDGWVNVLTGMGSVLKDKAQSAFVWWNRVTEMEMDALYGADDMAAKIVNKTVDESLRNGWEWVGISTDQADKLTKLWDSKKFTELVNHCWKTSRVHGGGGLLKMTKDIDSLEQPISENPIIESLVVLNRWELQIMQDDVQQDITQPGYLDPLYYTLQPRTAPQADSVAIKIHSSRIVRFDGVWLPVRLLIDNGYWGDSILNRAHQKIRNYSSTHDAIATIIQDFSIGVFKINGLAEMIGADDQTNLVNRMQAISLAKSMISSVVIDANGEDFDHKARSVAGLSDLVKMVEDRLVAATDMPHTVLLGHSPATSGVGSSTGESEETNWYDFLAATQMNYLKPKLIELAQSLSFELGFDLTKLDVTFNALERSDPTAEANIRYLTAQTDQIYLQNQVVDAIEIGTSRFGGDEYSTETEIDLSLRKKLPNLADDAAMALQAREVYQQPDDEDQQDTEDKLPALPGDKNDRNDGGPGSGPQGGGAGPKTEAEHRENVARTRQAHQQAEKDFKKADRASKRAIDTADTAKDRAEPNPKSLQKANLKITARNEALNRANSAQDAHIKALHDYIAHLRGDAK